jgi:2-(1,2-epoxy-1,2-dihydrophenyl)acetyl-CoA isomerase
VTVQRELGDGVARITIARPEVLNALDDATTTALARELEAVAGDDAVRCVVITGAGRAFSAGQDLRDNSADVLAKRVPRLGEELRRRYFPIVRAIRAMPKPVVAAVNGPAVGAGLGLACACDIRVASADALFRAGWSRVGLVPDAGAAYFLARLVGVGRAMDLLLTGDAITAAEALRIGLVTRVFEAAAFADELARFARSLAHGATRAFALTKTALERAAQPSLEEFLEVEARLQDEAGRTRDYAEAVGAFLEKREPRFQGR